jgi:hypothetical protein
MVGNEIPLLVSRGSSVSLFVKDDFSTIFIFATTDIEDQVAVGSNVNITFMVD